VRAALDPRSIEREIALIRERESNPFTAGVKTNLFTLLVLRCGTSASSAPDDPGETAIQYLLGRRPARIITLQPSDAPATAAWVSGRCFPDRKNRGVCFEEVHIECGADGLGADPVAWAPLLIRELPVFAWLVDGMPSPADPWERTIREAGGLIDKVIVDSSRFPAAEEPLGCLRRLRAAASDTTLLADFSWHRGRALREQSARAFDPPDMRTLLPLCTKVRLYGGSRAEAALFFRWLSARIGTPLAAEHAFVGSLHEGFRVTFQMPPGAAAFQMPPGAAAFPSGHPLVDIGCTKGGCISRGEEKGAYRFASEGEILLEELDTLTPDAVFREVLRRG